MNATTTPKAAPTNELMGALLLSQLDETTLSQFRDDPQAALISKLNIHLGDALEIKCVDNSADAVHLALPYYDSIDAAHAEKLSDMDLEDIAGGEIIIGAIIGAIVGAIVGAATGAVAAGTMTGAVVVGAVVGATVGAAATAVTVGVTVPMAQERDNAYAAGLAAGSGQPAPSGGK